MDSADKKNGWMDKHMHRYYRADTLVHWPKWLGMGVGKAK